MDPQIPWRNEGGLTFYHLSSLHSVAFIANPADKPKRGTSEVAGNAAPEMAAFGDWITP
jgi:hypothetical protein